MTECAISKLRSVFQKALFVLMLPVLVAFSACKATPDVRKLPSGRQIAVLGLTEMHFNNSAPALMLKYQTTLKIDDIPALQQEADEVWTSSSRRSNAADLLLPS